MSSTRLLTAAVAAASLLGATLSLSADTGGSSGTSSSVAAPTPTNPVFIADRDRWFTLLRNESKEANLSPDHTLPILELSIAVNRTPKLVNFRAVREIIHRFSTIPIDSDASRANPQARLRDLLLAHTDAILDRKYPGEYRVYFSESKAQASAASDFFAAVRDALAAGKLDSASRSV